MVRRLVLGLLKGLALGGAVAAALVAGLGVTRVETWLAFVCATMTGLLAGLVTGKPLWAQNAKVEAGLKGFFGALLAAGGLFALRTWFNPGLDLTAFNAGEGPLAELPAAYLPLLAGVLGALFEVDNTPSGTSTPPGQGPRVDASVSASTEQREQLDDLDASVGQSESARRERS